MTSHHSNTNIHTRSIGALLGCMCGDILGACVEGWPAEKIDKAYPKGLSSYQEHARGFGRYTDDTQMTLALALSIIEGKAVDPRRTAWTYASHFDMARGYGATAINVLHHLRQTQAADWQSAASKYAPGLGSYGNGSAMRISPVGIAYRNAPIDVLYRAVKDACVPTHTHPIAIDAAFILAATVAWLTHQTPANNHVELCSLQFSLLEHLMSIAATNGMLKKLCLLSQNIIYLPCPVESWETHLCSERWKKESALQLCLSEGEAFQIKADSAVAVALCAFLHHGMQISHQHPENAFVAACHYGGDTDTIAAMVGSCWGALHGYRHLPSNWIANMENGRLGRDDAVHLATRLATLDIKS